LQTRPLQTNIGERSDIPVNPKIVSPALACHWWEIKTSTKKMIVLGGEQPVKGLELALCRITRNPLHLANQFGPSTASFEQNGLKDPESGKSKELEIIGIIQETD
jgi:hypothetical protein